MAASFVTSDVLTGTFVANSYSILTSIVDNIGHSQ